jgi:hypothetical protein
MTTFYVATLSTYVLVNAESEDEALQMGSERIREQFGITAPVQIVRAATADEVRLQAWADEIERD